MEESQTQDVSGAAKSVGSAMEMEKQSCELTDLGTKMAETEKNSVLGAGEELNLRSEIDTSAPFESVKEAVSRFGGIGYWKPTSNKLLLVNENEEEISIIKLEEQASQLENDLILRQREALDILQVLESTRTLVEELRVKLGKETYQVGSPTSETKINDNNTAPAAEDDEEDKENSGYSKSQRQNLVDSLTQAQRKLTQTTNGIAEIRASVEVFNKKLEKDRLSLEKTRERLRQNSLKMSSMEEQLNQTKQKLQAAKDGNIKHGAEILKELRILNSEAEKFKQMGEAAKSEFLRTISKIERKKAKIKTAEIRLVAAAKMKEAAGVAEAIALSEIQTGGFKSQLQQQLDMEMLMKEVKEATKEIKSTKLALEEALKGVEAAKKEEDAVKKALKKWRWELDKGPIAANEARFEGMAMPVLKPTLSIGQILSRKLFLQEELMTGKVAERSSKVSLAQMLGKQRQNREEPYCRKAERRESEHKQSTRKRKKSGFARISMFLGKQKRKKPTLNLK